jgi:hypothetical protein
MAGFPSPVQCAGIAQQVRERFVVEIGRAIPELGKSMQERLSALMNEAPTSREMQSRSDT